MPSEFTQSPEIDAYNDTLSIFRHAPGKHVSFLAATDSGSFMADLRGYDNFVRMATFISSEGEDTTVYTCTARGMTVLITSDGPVFGIRVVELEQLEQLSEYLGTADGLVNTLAFLEKRHEFAQR